MIRYIQEFTEEKIIDEAELSLRIDELLRKHSEEKEKAERVVVALDGMCAAGKSTLARKLAERFGGEVISTDDFHLPLDMRSEERRSEPGGNLHYERFFKEVIPFIRKKESFSYGRFSCMQGSISEMKTVNADCPLVVVEGAYSMRTEFRSIYDLSICVLVSDELQKERLLAREGEEKYRNFEKLWMPLEHKYLSYYRIPTICDAVMTVTR